MEQLIERICKVMNASYNVPEDQIFAMEMQTKALAEQIVLIFGVENVAKMSDEELLKLGTLVDMGFSMGFKAGFSHAKSMMEKEKTR